MRLATTYLLLAATLAALLMLALRQGKLHEVRALNVSLQQQLEAAATLPPPSPAPAALTTNSVPELSAQEQNELLRLRGQIQPLRRELASLSNQLSSPHPSKARAGQKELEQLSPAQQARLRAIHAYLQTVRQRGVNALGVAIAQFLSQNDNQLPDQLAQVQSTAPSTLDADLLQSFELMRSGQVSPAEQSYTLVAREKQPQQLSDGCWGRVYLHADGTLFCGTLEGPEGWSQLEARSEANAQRRHHPPAP